MRGIVVMEGVFSTVLIINPKGIAGQDVELDPGHLHIVVCHAKCILRVKDLVFPIIGRPAFEREQPVKPLLKAWRSQVGIGPQGIVEGSKILPGLEVG